MPRPVGVLSTRQLELVRRTGALSVLPFVLANRSSVYAFLGELRTAALPPERARRAFERVQETTRAAGTDWALGIEARLRALLSDGDHADELYHEAIASSLAHASACSSPVPISSTANGCAVSADA